MRHACGSLTAGCGLANSSIRLSLMHGAEPRRKKKRKKKKLPRAPRPRQCCRRLCDHQRQVPTVFPQTLGIPVMMQRQVPTVYSFMLPLQFLDTVFDMPVVVLRQVPGLMVRPQLQSIEGRRLSLSFSRSSSSWSRLFTRPQRFSSCYSISGRRCPCCAGSCRFSGAAVEKTLALPQLQLAGKSVPCYVPPYLAVTRSVFAFGEQDFGLFWVMTSGNVSVLVQHWIHVYVSLRRLLEDFHIFSLSRWTSDPEVDAWCCSPSYFRAMLGSTVAPGDDFVNLSIQPNAWFDT